MTRTFVCQGCGKTATAHYGAGIICSCGVTSAAELVEVVPKTEIGRQIRLLVSVPVLGLGFDLYAGEVGIIVGVHGNLKEVRFQERGITVVVADDSYGFLLDQAQPTAAQPAQRIEEQGEPPDQ